MEVLQNWSNCILLTIVISGILEFITPEGETKKFVYLMIGIVTSVLIASPVIAVLKGDFDLEAVFNFSQMEDNFYYMETLSNVGEEQREMLQEVYGENVIRTFRIKYPNIPLSNCTVQFLHDDENKIKEIRAVTVYTEKTTEDVSFVRKKVAEICEISEEKVSVKIK
ncbi:MAG: stage III sporulation protein AF [Clostridia bacterium]|nr:stage III sporulation protein AF [Clostridia bacterium]